MAISRWAPCCIAAFAMLVSTGCKQIAPYPAANKRDAAADGATPVHEFGVEGGGADWQAVGDGESDGDGVITVDTAVDAPLTLDAQPASDFPTWSDASTCSFTTTNSKVNSDFQLTPTAGAWVLSEDGGYLTMLHFGRNEFDRIWLVAHFDVERPSSMPNAKLSRAILELNTASAAGDYEGLVIRVETPLDADELSEAQPATSFQQRRWPESGPVNVSGINGYIFSPDIAPLIQRVADDQHGGQIPEPSRLQLWIGAADVEGDPYSLKIRSTESSVNGTRIILHLYWCE